MLNFCSKKISQWQSKAVIESVWGADTAKPIGYHEFDQVDSHRTRDQTMKVRSSVVAAMGYPLGITSRNRLLIAVGIIFVGSLLLMRNIQSHEDSANERKSQALTESQILKNHNDAKLSKQHKLQKLIKREELLNRVIENSISPTKNRAPSRCDDKSLKPGVYREDLVIKAKDGQCFSPCSWIIYSDEHDINGNKSPIYPRGKSWLALPAADRKNSEKQFYDDIDKQFHNERAKKYNITITEFRPR